MSACLFWYAVNSVTGLVSELNAELQPAQSMIPFFLALWCSTLILLTFKQKDWLLLILMLIGIARLVDSWSTPNAMILFAGCFVGRGVPFLFRAADCEAMKKEELRLNSHLPWTLVSRHQPGIGLYLTGIVALLIFGVWWHLQVAKGFYPGTRWTGLWENPNIYGMLMGTGATLAVGLSAATKMAERTSLNKVGAERGSQGLVFKLLRVLACKLYYFFSLAAVMMFVGLFMSYSRGAWLAAVCGLTWLIANLEFRIQNPESKDSTVFSYIARLKANWLPAGVIFLSVVILFFWSFRQTEWHPVHRALSVSNQNDFSWRNRITAWEGALQIITEHPWFGAGWNRPEVLYQNFYLPPKSSESGAIEMNDYLMLGATLGIPALFCFGMYLWLSLARSVPSGARNSGLSTHNSEPSTCDLEWLQIVCHAGAIVLIVGFWFDGGLFKLPTAATFWILLELGSINLEEITTSAAGDPSFSRAKAGT